MRQTISVLMNFRSIAIDDRKAAYEATKYLLQLGHRKIAFVVSELKNFGIMKLRLEGYKEALEEADIPYDEALIENARSFSIKSGYQAFQALNQRCGGDLRLFLRLLILWRLVVSELQGRRGIACRKTCLLWALTELNLEHTILPRLLQ